MLAVAYLGLVLLPLGLAAAGARPPRSVLDELASGLGMLAFAIILVDCTLSGRVRGLSGGIGMDVTMRMHQLIARTALAAALLHPMLYQAAWNPPYPWDPSRLLTITVDMSALWSGILAWVLLPAFVIMAMTRGRPGFGYEVWRLTHLLGALGIAGLVLHHALAAGRYAADPVLAWVWIVLTAVAVATVLWARVAAPFWRLARPWTVTRVARVADRIWRLEIRPQGHPGLRFEAGQFVWLTVGHGPFDLRDHPFSIASAPAEGPGLIFLIKELGDFTRRLGGIAPGTRAYVDGPHGTLTVAGRDAPGIALIGGGIGIAPMIGLLRQLSLTRDPRPRCLVYADRREDQLVGRDGLAARAADGLREVVLVLQEPPAGWRGETGLVDRALLQRLFTDRGRRDWLYVLCGPPGMLDRVEDTLIALGVPADHILSERFDYD